MYLSQINLRKLFVGVIFIRLTTLGYELQQNLYCFKLSQTFFFGEIELILSPSPHYECQPIILMPENFFLQFHYNKEVKK